MYKKPHYNTGVLRQNESTEGETIEQKVNRFINNKEPITEGAPTIYTERKDGVLPECDVRNDKWDTAIDVMDKAHNRDLATRNEGIKKREEELKKLRDKEKNDGKTEPTQGTPGASE